jgi:[ribosomal protein S5]-alanine N-acetyltransferase
VVFVWGSIMNRVESKRFYYVELTDGDVTEEYVSWLNDEEISRYLETPCSGNTLSSVRKFVDGCQADPDSFLFGIFAREGGRHIGNIKIKCNYVNHGLGNGNIGIMIGNKNFWGKGVATESIRAITKFGFNVLGLQKIAAGCYEINQASFRAFKKSGYKVEGVIRSAIVFEGRRIDGIMFGILPGELSESRA